MLVLLKEGVATVEMGSDSMIYKQNFVKIGIGDQAVLVIVTVIDLM
jgi:hypothetical protein